MRSDPTTNRPAAPRSAPLRASAEPPRLVMLPCVLDASGAPLVAVAAGSVGRPSVRAYPDMAAALAALREAGHA
jgi:hypothetical protein